MLFNVGGAEILVIAMVALIAVGPEQLPGVLRRFGRFVAQARSMSAGIRDEFMSGLDEVKDMADPDQWLGTGDADDPIVPRGYAKRQAEAASDSDDDPEDDEPTSPLNPAAGVVAGARLGTGADPEPIEPGAGPADRAIESADAAAGSDDSAADAAAGSDDSTTNPGGGTGQEDDVDKKADGTGSTSPNGGDGARVATGWASGIAPPLTGMGSVGEDGEAS